jgi:hypothetical protein
VTADLRGGTDSLTVNAGTVTVPASNAGSGHLSRTFSTLSVAGGAKLVFAGPDVSADRTVVQVPAVSIAGGGKLDLDGNDMIVTGSTLAAVSTLVAAGYANGTWTGAGIDSSAAAGDKTHLSALGVVQNKQGASPLFSSANLFDGIAPAAGAVLIKSTYVGDTNLSGNVDGSDYSLADAGYAADRAGAGGATGWFNGDFNYDGTVDGSDYALLDNAFNNQGTAIPAAQVAVAVAASARKQPATRPAVPPMPLATHRSIPTAVFSTALLIWANPAGPTSAFATASALNPLFWTSPNLLNAGPADHAVGRLKIRPQIPARCTSSLR